jgi:hypothetical protein
MYVRKTGVSVLTIDRDNMDRVASTPATGTLKLLPLLLEATRLDLLRVCLPGTLDALVVG